MKNMNIEIFSIDMNKNMVDGWFEFEVGTNVLDILRSLGMEIKDNETACTVFEQGHKKTFFVKDRNGFKFVITIRA